MLISIFLFVDPTRIAVHDREVKVILSLKWADLTAAYFWLAAPHKQPQVGGASVLGMTILVISMLSDIK